MKNSLLGSILASNGLSSSLKDHLAELMKESGRGEPKELGKLSPELLAQYKAHLRKSKALKDEMEIEQRRLELELKRRMEEKFEDKVDFLENEKEELWRAAEAEFGLTKEADIVIDAKSGAVTLFKPEEPFRFKM